jgi:glycosyltransferase involved in cell wall biosynthesis
VDVAGGEQRRLGVGLVIGQLSAGGAEGQLALLCGGLRESDLRPVVYCLSDRTSPYRERIEASGVPVRVFRGNRLARVWALRRALHEDRIDIVHAWLFIANAYAWLANRGSRRPLITSARNCKRQGRVLDWLNQRAFAASSAIVANSHEVARYIAREYRAPTERIRVIYNGIDTDRFRPASDGPSGGRRVVMIGRLVPQKNPALFVRAAAALRRQIPDVCFTWIGDGPLRERTTAECAAAGLSDCCELTGERHDVPELLRAADLFWLTSDWEGLPNVVLEAMASGLPVVATDVGGTRELVHDGKTGFLVAMGDSAALVARSAALLRNSEQRRRCAAAARARAEEFSVPHMIGAMRQLYADTAGRH